MVSSLQRRRGRGQEHYHSNNIASLWLFLSILFLRLDSQAVLALDESLQYRLDSASATSAVIFPWFTEVLGVIVFFLITRFEIPVPYAAIMFMLGTFMGWGAIHTVDRLDDDEHMDKLSESILQWSNISAGVLLLVFLPGLIFRDAIEVNFQIFARALPQIWILANPMVLLGTSLTAVLVKYTVPFDWPLSLAATLGAVLSSTDPVAVGSVLKSAGAPPRLQIHISGESLLNDGSAVVFFTIFSRMFLADIGDGDPIDLRGGVAMYFRMAMGGTAVGLTFAMGLLLLLYELDRRLEPEYNVLQVVAALTLAYLSYFVSEQVCNMSGIIASVVCGITARALGRGLITDNRLMDSYLALMEYLLNTLLFTLGGVVYGTVIAGTDTFSVQPMDWVYLFVVYLLVMAIRFVQVACFYPVVSRLGLKSTIKEALFLAFGGLRGAVGIALALSLTPLTEQMSRNPDAVIKTKQLEFLAGGVTFLTLLINGTAAGPVLKWLELAKPVISRNRALRLFKASAEKFVNDEFTKLMRDRRFKRTDRNIVKEMVPFLKLDLQFDLEENAVVQPITAGMEDRDEEGHSSRWLVAPSSRLLVAATQQSCPDETLQELRGIYIDLLQEAYGEGVSNQELDEREDNGMNFELLQQSVAFAAVDADQQQPLHDWQYTHNLPILDDVKVFLKVFYQKVHTLLGGKESNLDDFQEERDTVLRALSFIEAHDVAERRLSNFVESLAASSVQDEESIRIIMSDALDIVLNESAQQKDAARTELSAIPSGLIDIIISNYVSTILLRRLAEFVERRAKDGLLTKKEARLYLDKIDHNIRNAHNGRHDKSNDSGTVDGSDNENDLDEGKSS